VASCRLGCYFFLGLVEKTSPRILKVPTMLAGARGHGVLAFAKIVAPASSPIQGKVTAGIFGTKVQ
jgi:hypothetical protein